MSNPQRDFFREEPQHSLFGEGEGRMQTPERQPLDVPVLVRARLDKLIAHLDTKPVLLDRQIRMWHTVLPQMCGALPDDEAKRYSEAVLRLLPECPNR